MLAAEKIGLIGVNPHPMDRHIWEPLADTEAELLVVGNKHAYEEWCDAFRNERRFRFMGERFHESLSTFLSELTR